MLISLFSLAGECITGSSDYPIEYLPTRGPNATSEEYTAG
jgi:hypothetical protein